MAALCAQVSELLQARAPGSSCCLGPGRPLSSYDRDIYRPKKQGVRSGVFGQVFTLPRILPALSLALGLLLALPKFANIKIWCTVAPHGGDRP
ncbi:hypothetical protein NDU88_006119 [Pleurodeles waltl]|uniref:Uncharacterized protein n=1 Tax=Pleurodeles waltl TaxID=8319 RepID=A0AAV7VNU1_PLEWA|nr:hypothetical protein NDU88_006119 [Pleurodeles waltl]